MSPKLLRSELKRKLFEAENNFARADFSLRCDYPGELYGLSPKTRCLIVDGYREGLEKARAAFEKLESANAEARALLGGR